MRYIALLRGINVGGNNKVSMPELKACFAGLGFSNITTYINSGNVIFESDDYSKASLVKQCEQAIERQFGFHIICAVITADELRNALTHAPDWWGKDPMAKHNALFIITPATADDVMRAVGEAKPEYEQIAAVEPIIFWTAPLKTFSRTRYSSIVGTKAYKSVTIRNYNTTQKLLALCE